MNKVLKLSDIRLDGDTQMRVEINHSTVQDYAESMKLGAKFTPMVVYFDGTDNWLANGFHRYAAYKSNGTLEAECEIVEGTLEDAQFYALSANGTNGLRPTPADNRRSCFRIFGHSKWSKMSGNAIAKHLNISPMTVSRYRKEWEQQNGLAPTTEVNYTRNGEDKTMMVDKHREKKSIERRYEEELPVPPPMTKEEELDQKLSEMTHLLKETIDENEKLRDAVATGQFDGSEIEKIDIEDTIRELREQIRLKDIEIQSLRESRDTYQNRAAELMKQVKVLQNKLKKAGIE
jgi:hypothetical protein